jgi:TonB family protein
LIVGWLVWVGRPATVRESPPEEPGEEWADEQAPREEPVRLQRERSELPPVRPGGDVTRPVKISGPNPQYTEIARKARIQGVVIVEAIIDKQGDVVDVQVLKPLPMGLDQAAVEAIRQWKFEPATLEGKPVDVYYNLTVNFRLK